MNRHNIANTEVATVSNVGMAKGSTTCDILLRMKSTRSVRYALYLKRWQRFCQSLMLCQLHVAHTVAIVIFSNVGTAQSNM